MYHSKFLWFADLSSPDKYFILPIVLGGLGFLQARIMPQQPGQDPQQQKMMMYMMPAIFTVMMLFLPAALGVYMTTNSVLGICQALLIERISKRMLANEKEITVTEVAPASSSLEKGKASV
jgi:YidC/Oxa1 family membrane protein insertase